MYVMQALTDRLIISPILAGRTEELATLQRRFESVQHGQGKVILVSGEAGIGKSRLICELKATAASLGTVALQGHCFALDSTLPLAPFIDLLRHTPIELLKEQRFLAAASQLLKLVPEYAPLFPDVQLAPIGEPEHEKRNLFHALTSWLAAPRSIDHPAVITLIVIEDLHWCDDLSLDLLLQLARAIATQPVLLVLTYRSDETLRPLNHLLAQFDRERLAYELTLQPLPPAAVDAMMRAIFDQDHPISREFLDAIYSLTEGNPFFVEEVLKSLVAVDDIFYVNGRWDRKKLSELRVPRTVAMSVKQRLAAISDPARHTLELACVIGQSFSFTVLRELVGVSEALLTRHLRELIQEQLVIELSADTFAFRHALTREAIYAMLLKRERREMHRLVGEVIEQQYLKLTIARDAELAYHFGQAQLWDKTLHYAQRAGEQAQAVFAPREAIAHFTQALEATAYLDRSHQDAVESGSLYLARGNAYEHVGEFDAALKDLEAALVAAHARGDQHAEWQALHDLGFLWVSRNYVRAGRYFDRMLDVARQIGDSTALAHSLNRVGNRLVNLDQPDEALRLHYEALRIFQALGDRQGEAATHDLLGLTGFMSGNVAEGVAHYEQAIAQFRALNDPGGLLSALAIFASRHQNYMGSTTIWTEEPIATRLHDGEEALRLARELGARPLEALALWSLGMSACNAGQYRSGFAWLIQAVALARELEHGQFVMATEWALGAVLQDVLHHDEALPYLERAYGLARETHSLYMQRIVAASIASRFIEQDKLGAAANMLEQELSPQLPMRTSGQRQLWCARAEWLLAKRDARPALDLLERLIDTATCLETRGRDALPRLSRLRGEALAAMGRYAEAEAGLVATLPFAQEWKPMLWRLYLSLGNLLRRQNRRDQADEAYARARSIITELANELEDAALRAHYLARAQALIPGATRKQAAKREHDGLTAREREVAILIARGKTNREIADALVVSSRTVDNHVANVLAKLGFASRAQVAAWAAKKWPNSDLGNRLEEN
jgi:DNA-binding CsgD family transcriptional regulator